MEMTGWNFEGSNWENPNTQDFRYWACLKAAIEERWEVLYRDRLTVSPGLDAISPYRFVGRYDRRRMGAPARLKMVRVALLKLA